MKNIVHIFLIISGLVCGHGYHQRPKLSYIAKFEHGEGPVWDPRTQLLYFVDIHRGALYSYDPQTEAFNFILLPGDLSPVVTCQSDEHLFVVGLNRSMTAVHWDGVSKTFVRQKLLEVAAQFPDSRFNDGKADRAGRLWIGTIGFEDAKGVRPNQGALYRVTSHLQPEVVVAPVNVSNGLAWNSENTVMYYIDTPTRQIKKFDYDGDTGRITNGKVAFDFSTDQDSVVGFPDGMTIDEDDNLWVALYGGGAVVRIDPRRRKLLQVIAIPALYVTSVMFGGNALDVLYVTTSRYVMSAAERKQAPGAGGLYRIDDLGTRGTEIYHTNIIHGV